MVYESIEFVRGAIINDDELRLLAQSTPSAAKEILSIYNDQIKGGHNEFSTEWWDAFYDHCGHFAVVMALDDQLAHGVSVHNWRCCSELGGEQYIVGVIYHSAPIDDIFHKTYSVPEPPDDSVDRKIREVLRQVALETAELRSIMMLDDCTSCS